VGDIPAMELASERKNPYNGVGFVFDSERGHIPSRNYEIGALRGENPCIFLYLSGKNPTMECLIPVERPSETHRLICVNTFMQGRILSSSVQTRFSEWGNIPAIENRSSAPRVGEIPLSGQTGCGK